MNTPKKTHTVITGMPVVLNLKSKDRDIHFSHESTHGGAKILCRESDGFHFVVSGLSTAYKTGIEGVFSADDNQLKQEEQTHKTALWYTFRHELITCPKCIKALKP